ncbi:hypothetical protein HanRHA438_Chr16g0787811 [Helianthus annuus]|nr:hypothetical protein HanRHA438_Chr16g0787811 [Helianthus annuus]
MARLEPIYYPLTGFNTEPILPLGKISYPNTITDGKHLRTEDINFMLLAVHSRHDIMLAWGSSCDFNIITSTAHTAIGFPTETGVVIIYVKKEVLGFGEALPTKVTKSMPRMKPKQWVLHRKYPEQTVTLGHAIFESIRAHLKKLLLETWIFSHGLMRIWWGS